MKRIDVKLKDGAYPIIIAPGLIDRLGATITRLAPGNYSIIVTCRKVYSLYGARIKRSLAGIKSSFVILPDGEAAKTRENLFKIIQAAINHDGWGKKIFITALGGGTVGDVAAFAASIYKRGVPCVNIPTTLLAQIDSSIGGKTAIDMKEAKNIVGTFYQPRAVLIDPVFLRTLKKSEIRQGLAEAVKYGVIADRVLFNLLYKKSADALRLDYATIKAVIYRCAAIKARVVARDPLEKRGLRTILNFGHTLAHALETCVKYQKLPHGEAVAIGMVYAAELSLYLGLCSAAAVEEVKNVLRSLGLPVKAPMPAKRLLFTIRYDKKFISGRARMVLMRSIGRVEVIEPVAYAAITRTLKKFAADNPPR